MDYRPWMGNLQVNGRWGNYGCVKLLADETVSGQSPQRLVVSVEIAGQGRAPADFEVELCSNLNRRDFVKSHETPQQWGSPTSYWAAYPMSFSAPSYDNLVYRLELPVVKCGAYRVTARYRAVGSASWWWHNDFAPGPDQPAQRDCAVVVSPGKAAQLRLYEANALTVEAMRGGSYENRSTLDDFLSIADFDGFNPFSLTYVAKELGFNALWLMPLFPNTHWRWDRARWVWAANEEPGSPYSSRDYWSLNRWLADNATSARALELFQMLLHEGATAGLDVMIDVAFNHAGRDVIYGSGAVELGFCTAQEAEGWIRQLRPAWCTRGVSFENGYAIPYYRSPARNDFECAVWAPADRLNEHIWDDANVDWFFGDYSALGPKVGRQATDYRGEPVGYSDPRGSAEDERDLYYTDLGAEPETEQLWQYFGHILPYWIGKGGGKLAGIRADFAQGLPNQLWEYIVNLTRKARWDFVFLAEVLDPDPIQYRLNRVFDLLSTKDHYLYRKEDLSMSELFASLEFEAQVLGADALVMHNGTSHDEGGNADKWCMTARYAVAASLYGVPMVFMGQPLGMPDKLPFRDSWASMYDAWSRDDPQRAPVKEMYRRINEARQANPELRGVPRYFLNLTGGGFHREIFAAARWLPAGDRDSVILAFVNLSPHRANEGTFALPPAIRLAGSYRARNLVADQPGQSVWDAPFSAADLYRNGIYVRFSFPNEVQYLKLEPV